MATDDYCGKNTGFSIRSPHMILRLLGTPTEKEWPGVSSLRDWHVYPQWESQNLASAVPTLGPEGVDLLTIGFQQKLHLIIRTLTAWTSLNSKKVASLVRQITCNDHLHHLFRTFSVLNEDYHRLEVCHVILSDFHISLYCSRPVFMKLRLS
ncbi:hypothetical protein HAX54_017331 [Datura stramonium]|uniref:Uncharacterized protein n=1 Tax=Datura stramonium TaxID=4076 RepID=A0ABS8UKI2_DATST|nr:hypothetical protein [Datura stramonium]